MDMNQSDNTVDSSKVIAEQPHRIVAESDLKALEAIWQSDSVPSTQNQDDNDCEGKNHEEAFNILVNNAVWELLVRMVRPVSDRAFNDHTLSSASSNDTETDEGGSSKRSQHGIVPPSDETWEAWVDTSALERVRQLRTQVRQKSSMIQEKRQLVLNQVETFLHQQKEQSSASKISLQVPPLAASVQQECITKAQETQQQVTTLVREMDDLHTKIPVVVERFHDTLATVQDEARQRQAEKAITAVPNDMLMLTQQDEEEENKAPAEDRLLRFLMTQ